MEDLLRFVNCNLVQDGVLRVNAELWVQNGFVVDQESLFFDHKMTPHHTIDCKGYYLTPGFIDIQINGAFGYDFSDESADIETSLDHVSRRLLQFGVTGFCPTIITSSSKFYHKTLPKVAQLIALWSDDTSRAQMLGMHLEGPFISQTKKGAHPLDQVRSAKNLKEILNCYGDLKEVSIVTLAPEIVEHNVITQLCLNAKVIVSIGHTTASLDLCKQAISSGARLITHLFNAMPSFHHREPSVIGCLTLSNRLTLPCKPNLESKSNCESNIKINGTCTNGEPCNGEMKNKNHCKTNELFNQSANTALFKEKKDFEQLYYGVICDNVHTHSTAISLAYSAYPEGFIIVTDAVAPMGLSCNQVHKLGTKSIVIKENRAFIEGTDTLCGSIASMDECVRIFRDETKTSVEKAINCATINPASMLGKKCKGQGSLSIGSPANFILLDSQLFVQSTYRNGKLVWNRKNNL